MSEDRVSAEAASVIHTDVLVVGAGLGGVAAALAAARGGASVVLTEETDWLGGQMTSQAVPPDEHPWIESFGRTRSYARLRDDIRKHYRTRHTLSPASAGVEALNPGAGLVSPICHEPRVSAAVLEETISPYLSSGRLRLLRQHRPIAADLDGRRVRSVTLKSDVSGAEIVVSARYVLDATETGDLLPLTDTEHVTGFESRHDTGEPEAPAEHQPLNIQAVSWCFAIEHVAGEDHTIRRPDDYDYWKSYRPPFWPGPMLGLVAPHPHDLRPRAHRFDPNPHDDPSAVVADQSVNPGSEDLWLFRRILARNHFEPAFASDVTLVNWPMIDYLGGPLFAVPGPEAAANARAAKSLSRAFLYWLQTEAPREDGSTGYPGLRLRPDVMGTEDGFAKTPYHRESRRIVARQRVTANEFSVAANSDGAISYADSVGVGAYRIDLHPSTGGDNFIDVPAHPFEIPLGALLPRTETNLIAAAKNIGTTHISSGAYRVHPVEWNIGESAGVLARFCTQHDVTPYEVLGDRELLARFQRTLASEGIETTWPQIAPW